MAPSPERNRECERVRRYRARKRVGRGRVVIDLIPNFADDPVQFGRLPADKREDHGAVDEAIGRRAQLCFKAPFQ